MVSVREVCHPGEVSLSAIFCKIDFAFVYGKVDECCSTPGFGTAHETHKTEVRWHPSLRKKRDPTTASWSEQGPTGQAYIEWVDRPVVPPEGLSNGVPKTRVKQEKSRLTVMRAEHGLESIPEDQGMDQQDTRPGKKWNGSAE